MAAQLRETVFHVQADPEDSVYHTVFKASSTVHVDKFQFKLTNMSVLQVGLSLAVGAARGDFQLVCA